jgi:hypothetical protein
MLPQIADVVVIFGCRVVHGGGVPH